MARRYAVMVSSSFRDLKECRAKVRDAILGLDMHPLMMEPDSANPNRGIIENSLAKVDEADAYVVLISSYRYGQIIDDAALNPKGLSVTELEFERAEERKLPICVFLMDETAPVAVADVMKEAPNYPKLQTFRARANHHSRITATFRTEDELKAQVTQTLARLKTEMDAASAPARPTDPPALAPPAPPPKPAADTIPAPPAFCARPPYIPGCAFQGRVKELAAIRDWAGAADPVMLFEAIGGMGKSMVTWEWITKHAAEDCPGWAGIMWYSFYERGADMRDFCATALAYMTGGSRADLATRPAGELADALLGHLRAQRWLLVLDGLERVLIAYNRYDAAQLADAAAETSTGATGGAPTKCIRPEDDDLLRRLAAAGPSKLLMSSRLMPLALLNEFGQPLQGVRRLQLPGLDPRDAEAMLRAAGISGDGERMRRDLERRFGCHPLVVGVVGGLVLKDFRARANYDRWADDPQAGGAAELDDPDIRRRQDRILKLAFAGLTGPENALLARIAMLTDAADWETLEALNPQRPPPPEAVMPPRVLDLEGDRVVRHLRARIAGARLAGQRADLERRIAERQRDLRESHEAARQRYAGYQAALAAWQGSPSVRDARRCLKEALHDLETRGLLQCDHRAGNVDLHPVVRSYVVASLGPEARASAGQSVADHFAARPPPAYDSVTNWLALANAMQVVQALNLAGKKREAWAVLRGDLRVALYRLERHHEALALLRPLFPAGWSAPPEGIDDPSLAANEAAVALAAIGRLDDAAAQEAFAIREGIKGGISAELAIRLQNHSATARRNRALARSERLTVLARDVAAVAESDQETLWCDLFLLGGLMDRGALAEARALWAGIASRLPDAARQDGQLEAQAREDEAWLLFREGAFTGQLLDDALARVRALGEPAAERSLLRLAGAWHQAAGRDEKAVSEFGGAIALAHAAGLRDTASEAGRGLSLARLGRADEARAAAAAAEDDPPHDVLAALYLALGERDKARHHAQEGYKLYWADGPPYAFHWELEACRAVLRELGEPDPPMRPYDPATIAPIDFEPDIRRLLAEHASKSEAPKQ